MEDFVLLALADELRQQMTGLTLEALYQVGMTEMMLTAARGPGRIVHLFISLALAEPKVYILNESARAELDAQETPFTARLMRTLADREIKELVKLPYDRVLRITLVNPYQSGPDTQHLYLELIDRGANLFLVDDEARVVEAFHSDFDRRRALTPGRPYEVRPRAAKQDPRSCTEAMFYETLGDLSRPPWAWTKMLMTSFLGLSPTLAQEIVARAGEDRRQLWPAFQQVLAAIYENAPQPRIYTSPVLAGGPTDLATYARNRVLSTIELRHLSHWSATRYATVNEAVRTYYESLAERRAHQELSDRLRQAIRARRTKVERLLKHLSQTREEFDQAETYKRKGELLLANLYRLQPRFRVDPRGEPVTISVENYYEDPPCAVELTLDPKISLQANAERYFQQYRKAKRGLQVLEKKIPTIQAELQRLQQYEDTVAAATTLPALQAASQSLKLSKPSTRKRIEIPKAKRQTDEISVRRFWTSDRFEVLVGRSRRENDQLTFRVAAPHDVWMHAADYPGSHVVIRNPQKVEVPERSIREAAQIAAYYSQARKNGKVTVHHTLRKFVHKPKNAPPGLVTLSQFRSITVAPQKGIEGKDEG